MKRDYPARVMQDGFAKRDCKFVDISDSGARIAISGSRLSPPAGSASHLHQRPALPACLAKWDHGRREVPEVIPALVPDLASEDAYQALPRGARGPSRALRGVAAGLCFFWFPRLRAGISRPASNQVDRGGVLSRSN
jgi:hypothetical protein